MTYETSQGQKSLALLVLWAARILGVAGILFLSFMILGHVFGDEPQNLNGMSDIAALTFFPGGLLLGLIVALRSEKTGGAIAVGSMCVFFLLRPDTLANAWILGLFAPALLFFAYGWWLKPKSP